MFKIHELKTLPSYFKESETLRKPFELRKSDRDFRVGDYVVLQEWDPAKAEYTGRFLTRQITYVLDPTEVMKCQSGFVVLGVMPAAIPSCGLCEESVNGLL